MYEPSEYLDARTQKQLRAYSEMKSAQKYHDAMWWFGLAVALVVTGNIWDIARAALS